MTTHVFYTPHADDETLAMAGAILSAHAAGSRVVLVLVTDNEPSRRAIDLYSDRLRCHWHDRQKHDLAAADIRAARLLEFMDAATRLHADEVATIGIPERLGRTDYPMFVAAIAHVVRRYASTYPGAKHHFIAGDSDPHVVAETVNLSHQACVDAALATIPQRHQLRFHRVYVYSRPTLERTATAIERLTPVLHELKRDVMDAYRIWQPEAGRLAFGYHSVPELFDAAAIDPREFVDLVAA